MSTQRYQDAAKKFTSSGIKPKYLLPIAPRDAAVWRTGTIENALGKTPGRYNARSRTWAGLGGNFITEGVTKADYEEMRSWPTPNVGVLGRAYPAIDSDAENDDARRLVEDAIYEAFGPKARYGERVRGASPRRLYAFRCEDFNDPQAWVRGRHLAYRLGGQDHKLDIIGYGNQFVITGVHPSGDLYEWRDGSELTSEIDAVSNSDMERFIDIFTELLEEKGGALVRTSGGRVPGDEYDPSDLEPVMSVDDVLKGLDALPNNEENFPHRDDLVSILSAVRAALGKDWREAEADIAAWATADSAWCDDDYFDKIWRSIDRVRVERNALDRVFRSNNILHHVKNVFDNKTHTETIQKTKTVAADTLSELLDEVAGRYVFGGGNTRDGNGKLVMRSLWDVEHEFVAYDWWRMELPESDHDLLARLQQQDNYTVNKVGLANFLRDMKHRHPQAFYVGEVKHPNYDIGEIYREPLPDGRTKNLLNMRFLSSAIRHARKPDPDPRQSKDDVQHILEFGSKLFGKAWDYELSTLAYMAQTGKRPGTMLFMVGESGVGKSLWTSMQCNLFDGSGQYGGSAMIDGTSLVNDSGSRFSFGGIEGSRIAAVQELPAGHKVNKSTFANMTSKLKQIVDAGPGGDFVSVERKGVDARLVRNHCRVIVTTNHAQSMEIEDHDRRIFYVEVAITIAFKPPEEFYAKMGEIIADPKRLAAFWRYLMTVDVSNYEVFAPAPVTVAKAERMNQLNENPAERHLGAALAWLRESDRRLVEAPELVELMSELSEAEYICSGGTIDNRTKYSVTSPAVMTAIRNKMGPGTNTAVKLPRNDFRTSTKRAPTIYVMEAHKHRTKEYMEMLKTDLQDELRAEYEAGVCSTHPWRAYQAPRAGE